MFDLGFSEIFIIAVVGLIVLGPERLPRVARTVGRWVSKGQRYVGDLKNEISKEAESSGAKELQNEFQSTAASLQKDINSSFSDIKGAAASIEQAASGQKGPVLPSSPGKLKTLKRDPYTAFNRSEETFEEVTRVRTVTNEELLAEIEELRRALNMPPKSRASLTRPYARGSRSVKPKIHR